jgi:hypothetical protein
MENEVINIDGKPLCGSYDTYLNERALHVVSAYASANQLTLGQVLTDKKSNEITAVPQLLKLIDLKDTTVSIDAMGCQKEIASTIRQKNAHYLLARERKSKRTAPKYFAILRTVTCEWGGYTAQQRAWPHRKTGL